ncbi:MAG TPA: hypothetical protein VJR95_00135 [Rhodanobacter sp.]|nr:hypothetical protein [Rhodanobacter sp.]
MRRILLALALSLPLVAIAASDNISKISDDIHVGAGQQAGHLDTVSGDIDVGDRATVGNASTVSGSITLGSQAQARKLGTVSGDIQLDRGAIVAGNAQSVSGSIHLAQGAQVQGHLSNVSDAITLDDAHVANGIETVAGDITVGTGSRVEGGILVDRPNNGGIHFGNRHKPVIVIGPRAVVQGTLEFRQPVVLKVSDSAQIGTVTGATVEKFSGAAP